MFPDSKRLGHSQGAGTRCRIRNSTDARPVQCGYWQVPNTTAGKIIRPDHQSSVPWPQSVAYFLYNVSEVCYFVFAKWFLILIYYQCNRMCFFFRWTNLNESIRSGMAVLDVGIPTGYYIQQQKLDTYILSRRVRNLQRARYQERKVLFYFDYVSKIQNMYFKYV